MVQAKILSLPDEGSLATPIANDLRKPVTISLSIIQLQLLNCMEMLYGIYGNVNVT